MAAFYTRAVFDSIHSFLFHSKWIALPCHALCLKSRSGLNGDLPIPFDGRGLMEVDCLCVDLRLAIELDGAQHLNDPAAYRRDRRKDKLLQENGTFVLRLPAEDVGKRAG